MTPDVTPQRGMGVRPYVLGGFSVIFLLGGGIGVWAARTQIAGAVIAPATVVVDSNVKKVQHPTGGIVGEIRVKNGDPVEAGQLLVRLDETVTRANLRAITAQLDELGVREARLIAERDERDGIGLPGDLARREAEPGLSDMISAEGRLFTSRRAVRNGQKLQLAERIAQLKQEIGGIGGQAAAKAREIELIGEELSGLETLESKQLVTATRMVALRREAARLDGELGQLKALAAQAKGRIAEIELQTLRIDQDLKSEVTRELREIQAKQAELAERKVAAADQMMRVDIRAPHAGRVHQLAVHTLGGVVGAGETLMMVVPDGDKLVIEARIAPQDIDQVLGSGSALVRFAAFNQRTTPELEGRISTISADLARDAVTGEGYFVARVEIAEAELGRLEGKALVPGMPAEVQIRTQDRTALSYLMKPIEDQIARAFRER